MERDPLVQRGPEARRSAQPLRAALVQDRLTGFLVSLRPQQWTKNLIIFAGLLFGQRLVDGPALGTAIGAFAIFCALSSAMYLLNDVLDREEDRRHPTKSLRPIAAGTVSPRSAVIGAVALSAAGIAAAPLTASFRPIK